MTALGTKHHDRSGGRHKANGRTKIGGQFIGGGDG